MSQTYFCNDWLSKPDYADWLQAVPGDNKVARCKLCFKTFGLSNMGVGAWSHMERKKHQSIKSPAAFLTHGSSEGRFVSQSHHVCRNCSSGLLPWRTNMQFEQCARAHRRRHIDHTSQFKPTVYSN